MTEFVDVSRNCVKRQQDIDNDEKLGRVLLGVIHRAPPQTVVRQTMKPKKGARAVRGGGCACLLWWR